METQNICNPEQALEVARKLWGKGVGITKGDAETIAFCEGVVLAKSFHESMEEPGMKGANFNPTHYTFERMTTIQFHMNGAWRLLKQYSSPLYKKVAAQQLNIEDIPVVQAWTALVVKGYRQEWARYYNLEAE